MAKEKPYVSIDPFAALSGSYLKMPIPSDCGLQRIEGFNQRMQEAHEIPLKVKKGRDRRLNYF